MRAWIVVESSFGNTREIAGAVAEGLGRYMTVDVRDVEQAPGTIDDEVDLLVVGGPTHALGMSRPDTRRNAARQAGHPAADVGVREWLESGPVGIRQVAAFDTRINKAWVPGSAARGIAKLLRRLGGTLVAKPESFRVVGTAGPLAAGELDRARRWGEQLAAESVLIGSPPSKR